MAEIAIPILLLGSMFVVSNQSKKSTSANSNNISDSNNISASANSNKEGYTNMMPARNPLPGINPPTPTVNYPSPSALALASNSTEYSKYTNPNQVTDKYFNGSSGAGSSGAGSSVAGSGTFTGSANYSLSGKQIDANTFKHNNMVPFFGGKIKGATVDMNVSESMLDNMQGQGSQQIKKQEQAPMFQPHQNLQYANGSPNMSDFLQSRVNPSMRMANVKPWEEQKVAPGLNKGFTTEGSNGFNSGMEARDSWLPKTVNELRVDTNPKMTFGLNGHEGPARSFVQNSATIETQGKVEKYAPDTYYTVGQDRWFTTTGLEKGQTARSIEVMPDVNRLTTSAEYYGVGTHESEAGYAKGEYQEARRPVLNPNDITNVGAVGKFNPTVADYGIKSYNSLPNNRSTTRPDAGFGIVGGLLQAVVSPILDVLRPSRKENVIGNIRATGNVNALVPNGTVFNPADRTKTTIREMTEGNLDCNHLNVEKQAGNAYLVSKQQPVHLQRDTTNVSYSGGAGPKDHAATMSYDAAYMQHNNVNKTYPNRPNQGGTQIFNQNDNISIHRRDADRDNTRTFARSPLAGYGTPPSSETYGKLNAPQYTNANAGCERIQPDILTAFKNNPYTQSLNSWA